jgi:hypothetical protein
MWIDLSGIRRVGEPRRQLCRGTELTLDACAATIRSLLLEANITTLVWDHPVSEPSMSSSPEALPLVDRLEKLYPDRPDIVDPSSGPSSGSNPTS